MTLQKLVLGPGRLFVKPLYVEHGQRIDGRAEAMMFVPDDAHISDAELEADGWDTAHHCQYRLRGFAVVEDPADIDRLDHPDD